MSDHKARELEHDTAPKHPKGRKETFAERDPLAAEEPTVLESVLSIILRKFQQATASRRHDHSSSSDTSRYLLD
ncbi:hypothetical protein, partial [Adlercreutzia sp. CNCM I-6216]